MWCYELGFDFVQSIRLYSEHCVVLYVRRWFRRRHGLVCSRGARAAKNGTGLGDELVMRVQNSMKINCDTFARQFKLRFVRADGLHPGCCGISSQWKLGAEEVCGGGGSTGAPGRRRCGRRPDLAFFPWPQLQHAPSRPTKTRQLAITSVPQSATRLLRASTPLS